MIYFISEEIGLYVTVAICLWDTGTVIEIKLYIISLTYE